MRSFSAALRIGREQVLARDNPGLTRLLLSVVAPVFIGCLVAWPFVNETVHKLLLKVVLGSGLGTVALTFGVLKTYRVTNIELAEEKELRKITLQALQTIAASEAFKVKPLDSTQKSFIRDLLRTKDADGTLLRPLLELES